MRELKVAVQSTDPGPRGGVVRFTASWWRNALLISVLVHAAGVYVAGRIAFIVDEPPPLPDLADFFWSVERVVPPPSAPPPSEAPRAVETPSAPVVVDAPVTPEIREQPAEEAAPPSRVATEVVPESAPAEATAEAELPSRNDLEEARLRAAEEVIAERSGADSYLTFTIDDVAPPRPEPEPKPERSIFDGGGADYGGRSVATVGQQRTKFGRKLAELCNALTGGLGVSFQGFGLFSACANPDDEPSGLFPEVRPAYLDLLPECAESQPENPELAAAAPFSTVKCRLVDPVEVERWAYPGQPRSTP